MAALTPRDMHGAEVHDCFSITEIVATEILGLAELGAPVGGQRAVGRPRHGILRNAHPRREEP